MQKRNHKLQKTDICTVYSDISLFKYYIGMDAYEDLNFEACQYFSYYDNVLIIKKSTIQSALLRIMYGE